MKRINIFTIFVLWFMLSGMVIGFTIPPTSFNNSELKNSNMIQEKKCSKCGLPKSLTEFAKRKKNGIYLQSWCMDCTNDKGSDYHRTKKGLIATIYRSQKKGSLKRNYPLPTYTKEQLIEWCFNQPIFHEIFDNWKVSGYEKDLSPSCDRVNDYDSYNLGNIQLMTWKKNRTKYYSDAKNGINNKKSKAVIQFDLDGNFIEEYYSISNAHIITNIRHISCACSGKRKTAGGYIWKYKNI